MRSVSLAALAALAACASPISVTTATLISADAATSLAVGERLTEQRSVTDAAEGQDSLVLLQLQHSDGRALSFEEANHTPNDLMAQAAGGPLAQIMGLFGEETPTLYRARQSEHKGEPFLCGPDGPAAIGVAQGADGSTQIVALRQELQFEVRPDGVTEALPYSPDQVCARLRLRRS
jgi:hypothetical protein